MRESAPGTWFTDSLCKIFKRTAILAFLITGIFLSFCSPAKGQISPGPLSKAHSSLNGTSHCNSCHQFGASAPTYKCLECHKEVAQDLSAKHGYHFQIQMQNPHGKDCVRCHLEHNGENFKLIHWEPSEEKFDHRLTGYKLEGKHASLACEKCHKAAHMLPANRELIKMKDVNKSFFGQSSNCTPCHSDPHKGQLGNECTKCHNLESWKAAKNFDHSKTRYPLTGLHSKVACEKCHKPDVPGGAVRYQDMKFDSCSACHNDPHRGSFKKTCDSCHTTSGWKTMLAGFDFDHSKTKYPLQGKHAQVSCVACHVNGDFKKPLPFANCKDCHTPDPHKGQFDARAKKGECAECHTVDGWKPSLFGVKEHDTSKYPLKGKHVSVECAKCHIPAGKDTVYKVKFEYCSDCHKDAHDNQFAGAPYNNRCEPCHTVQDFHRPTFTIAKHRNTRFALAGAHVAVPCGDCHKVGGGGRTDKIVPYHFENRDCTACHRDPHKGEFNDRMSRKRANGTAFGCEACHNVKSWADINGFDHSKTKFPLVGAHRTVVCGDCHRATTGYESRFKGTPQQCEACHNDAHDSQFVAKDGKTHCGDCHNAQRWVPSTFDHDTRTHFALTGGHANVECAKCHVQTRQVGEKLIVAYKNTPNKCVDCHGNDPKIRDRQPLPSLTP
ncbi:MAG TPA: cytochrome c3 family protein [Candidatus Acidoferrum sp.]